MPLEFFITVIRNRFWLILFTLAATVGAGLYFWSQEPPRYTASTSLIINFSTDNPFEDYNLPPQLADSYLATQVEIIGSHAVAAQVAKTLSEETDPARDVPVGRLLNNLKVETTRESRVIQVAYEAGNPETASKVANLFAESYIANANRLSIEPSQRNAELLTTQLESMRSRLETAQAKLSGARKEQGIVALDERLDSENMRLAELSNQLVAAQAQTYDVRSRQLGVNHPEYVRAVQSERAVQASLDEQKQHVLDLKQRRDELAVLSREVEVEKQAYETALQSYYQQTLRSRIGGISVAVLDPALPPLNTSNPGARLTIAGSVMLGLILGFLVGIAAELMFRKVRTRADVEELIDPQLVRHV